MATSVPILCWRDRLRRGVSEEDGCHPLLCACVTLGPCYKAPQTGQLEEQNLFPPSSGTQKSEIKVSQGQAPPGGQGRVLPAPSISRCFQHSWACSRISPLQSLPLLSHGLSLCVCQRKPELDSCQHGRNRFIQEFLQWGKENSV